MNALSSKELACAFHLEIKALGARRSPLTSADLDQRIGWEEGRGKPAFHSFVLQTCPEQKQALD